MIPAEASHPFTIRRYGRLTSTNDTARALAAAGAPHGTVVWARSQSAGRGRQGRTWFSPPGNLYVSVILRPCIPPARLAELGFLAALGVAEALDDVLGARRAELKWPNDVLLEGRKVAGILSEAGVAAGAPPAVILGIGINLREAPAGTPYPATSLAAEGAAEVTPGRMLDALLAALARWLARWAAEGFAPARAAWMGRAHRLGRPARVRTGEGWLEGRLTALDEDGALLIETAAGPRRVTAGEVAFAPGEAEGGAPAER
jgi:BirA family biotin operon repressor/biotin-[acetyl-CoA-carboxylase] ligase